MNTLSQVKKLIRLETARQERGLVMIASENYCPQNILDLLATPLSNKYSEGYPGKRYYTGNRFIDEIETLACQEALKMFGWKPADWHANVQPHSGSSANLAVYLGLLKPGDKIIAMDLAQGGHLTHGSPVNASGQLFKFIAYGVDKKTEKLDYTQIEALAIKHKPKMIVCGATAYSREIDFKKFSRIAKKCDAYLLADISHIAGLIVGDAHPSPFPYADIITSTTHKTLTGPRGAFIVCKKELAKNIDKSVFPGMQGGPLENIIAAKAVCFARTQTKKFKDLQKQTVLNAKILTEIFSANDIKVISGGTDNHLLLLDVRSLKLTGKIAADILAEAEIYTNANMIPFDPATALNPSGLRSGTPALTTRGLKEKEMALISLWIVEILKNPQNKELRKRIKQEVHNLAKKFSIYSR